ncbi:MAG: helix-turn-helix domain-containing protein [Rhodocyclaceae bacterium]|nr:helix-turn-helix domain-containing protein [Rhodocyclaceae bacterium]
MPAKAPDSSQNTCQRLAQMGEQIRAQRKVLGLSAAAVAEAAGMSRVTLHRLEKGEPSVTAGSYLNAAFALGLDILIARTPKPTADADHDDRNGWIPVSIGLDDYPQLRQLAWQVTGTNALTPQEAWGIYERNGRHLDVAALSISERKLIDALGRVFGGDTRAI